MVAVATPCKLDMREAFAHIVAPFATGFVAGGLFCLGVYAFDIGGIGSLIWSAGREADLAIELIRFASAFGCLSVATYHGLALLRGP